MSDPKNWLVVSVFINAMLGGLLASILSESESVGTIVLVAVFVFAVVMTAIANHSKSTER